VPEHNAKLVKFFGFDEGMSSSSRFLKDTFLRMGFKETPGANLAIIREDSESLLQGLQETTSEDTRVLLCSELRGIDFDLFDYVIGWELGNYGDRYVRLHPALRESKTLEFPGFVEQKSMNERAFCDFIYSNSRAHPFRDAFFRALDDSRRVSSLGPHLFNGAGMPGSGQVGNWEKEKIKLQSNFKFSIAIENAFYSGYTTEKLLTSILAGSIPIYWGNPDVGKDFNEARFINLHKFQSIQEAIEYILSISEDYYVLEKISREPLFTDEQAGAISDHEEQLRELIERAHQTSLARNLRRPDGTSPWQRESLLFQALRSRKRARVFQEMLDAIWLKLRKYVLKLASIRSRNRQNDVDQ